MYDSIIKEIENAKATIVAVSKTKSNSDILNIYNKGQRIFGENRVAEMVEKYESLPQDISWHMIGHLQSKKVKLIAPFVDLIHSCDRFSLLDKIDAEAKKHDRVIPVLLQFKIAEEDTKYGLDLDEAIHGLSNKKSEPWQNISIQGVMGMATFTSDKSQVKTEFKKLKSIYDCLKKQFFNEVPNFKEISMGMSGDYKLALIEGSTMVRIGSLIFGNR